MHSNSMMKAVLAVVLCVSLATTGCTAEWIKVALADLPVLTQMALNIASLVAALETGKQVSAHRGGSYSEYFRRSWQRSESASSALLPIQCEPGQGHPRKNPKRNRRHQPEL